MNWCNASLKRMKRTETETDMEKEERTAFEMRAI